MYGYAAINHFIGHTHWHFLLIFPVIVYTSGFRGQLVLENFFLYHTNGSNKLECFPRKHLHINPMSVREATAYPRVVSWPELGKRGLPVDKRSSLFGHLVAMKKSFISLAYGPSSHRNKQTLLQTYLDLRHTHTPGNTKRDVSLYR